ncbi:MAG TPA: class 1 fructose-bisphosphatase [Oligoflexia bacterium]|nr:class 1 fructose-bisphosphatase [Oligoflexia bacterium]HMP27124.1 class 1 fructose-bisphosphatase [Oligoflexia bacterium]
MFPVQTLARFITTEQRKFPGSSGELTDLLLSISIAVKMIAQLVATAGFRGLQGYSDGKNVHGEMQQKLDREADSILMDFLSSSGHFGLLVSEERDQVIVVDGFNQTGKYVVAFDPLDGSSNLGSNIPVGTIFAIFKKNDAVKTEEAFLQKGRLLIAAGYAIYGAKTEFVYAAGGGVNSFTLDPSIGEFLLTGENLKIAPNGSIYSFNEGNFAYLNEREQRFIDLIKTPNQERGLPLALRYVGSLVADFDRTLRKGGIFLYPADKRYPHGKLRLLYECVPLAYICERAGGLASDGKQAILDIVPESIHQRSPLIIGSSDIVETFLALK